MRNLLSATLAVSALVFSKPILAEADDLSLAEMDPVIGKYQQIEGEWTYSSCGNKKTSPIAHVFKEGDIYSLSIKEDSDNRVEISHPRWTMIEQPVIRMVDGKIQAADGIAVIDDHQHRVTFIPTDNSSCAGVPKDARVIRIEYSDINYSHGDALKHGGVSHGHEGH